MSSSSSSLHRVSSSVHPDLQKERNQATFSSKKMAFWLYGRKRAEKYEWLGNLLANNPSFNTRDLWWMNSKERYIRACEQAEEFVRIIRDNRLMEDENNVAAMQVMAGEDFFLMLHLTMFIPSLEKMADDEQQKAWLTPAKDFRLLGTYCQTELGHGSNVSGLETTADFDIETDEWVCNTPTLSSTKWWPGGIGKSCTHCVLMARLRIGHKDFGVHPFFLPLRDINTHKTLPGITLRHIGQKLGYNGMDNGAVELCNVRIPRRNLLMRFYNVDRQGNYETKSDVKLLYATMTWTRKQIILCSGVHLAKNACIATRYSAVRRQFASLDNDYDGRKADPTKVSESQVVDYLSQQYVLFPLLANAAAFIFCARWVDDVYHDIMHEAKRKEFSRLGELHVITSALKAVMTQIVHRGIDNCWRACGGHGYLLAAGIPLHLTSYVPQTIYEGDFVVLSIQAGRSLLKVVQRKMQGRPLGKLKGSTLEYIYEYDPQDVGGDYKGGIELSSSDLRDPAWQLKAFKKRSCALIYSAARKFAAAIANEANMLQALDEVKIELTRITKSYAHVLILDQFHSFVKSSSSSPQIHDILKSLCDLYALYWLDDAFGEFLLARVMSADDHEMLMESLKSILKEIRPNAVAFAESFAIPDNLLNSALGRYDGRVYEALNESTRLEPLNNEDVTEGYYRHIQYILHPERRATSVSSLDSPNTRSKL